MLFIYLSPCEANKESEELAKILTGKKTGIIDGGIRIKEKYGSQIYESKVRVSQGSTFHLVPCSCYMWPANLPLGFPAAEANFSLTSSVETQSSITGVQVFLREKVVTAFGSWCQIHNCVSIFSGQQGYVMGSEVRIEQNLKSKQSASLEPPCFSFHYPSFVQVTTLCLTPQTLDLCCQLTTVGIC